MTRKIGDAEAFLLEDLVVYTLILLLALFWDQLFNILISAHLYNSPDKAAHPYDIGGIQVVIIIASVIQIFRTISRLKYHSNFFAKLFDL